jgi:hypothetical protein
MHAFLIEKNVHPSYAHTQTCTPNVTQTLGQVWAKILYSNQTLNTIVNGSLLSLPKFVSCVVFFFGSCNKKQTRTNCCCEFVWLKCLSKLRLEVGKKVVFGHWEVEKGSNQSQTYCKGSSVNTGLIDTHTHTHTHTLCEACDKFLYSMTHVHDVWIQTFIDDFVNG